MKDFIKIQYQFNNITKEEVQSLVPKYLTQEEANEIIKEE